ncbi:MAG: hypothetical protein CMP76_15980 [Flavobacterium sp.]|uniref:CCC motif membrane protein n=1 Tax=unclassified Flavobacterium TaxID=196869 RepID=UPI000C41BC27|nr:MULTISPECIES: CCC motif membrane protein [unclassified Flavobacterium]MBF04781.1 hypothetical protein [Flavobacterium sp.]MCO6163143.1 DUF4190 domain-containing protein [Flavobacterium sp. NRK F7]|tara:strand:+ start:513 stop:836 length:324 start_codon:yes stop_codon:yes gene_type:complete
MENQKLPNATAVLILGILSILTCCCYGVIGLVLGIIGLVISKKDLLMYKENPSLYSNYSNLNIGRILCIIGIVLSAIYVVYMIFLFSTLGMDGIQQMQEEMMRKYGA